MKFLTPEKLERLCCLLYSDSILKYIPGQDLGTIANDMIRETPKKPRDELVSECNLNTVLSDIIIDKELSKLVLTDIYDVPLNYRGTDKTPGNRIITFSLGRKFVIVFRGTHGDAEWADNGARMYQTETRELLDCAAYVNGIYTKYIPDFIVTAGHSGGGNKSMYCFLTCKIGGKYTVDECFSLDGQGFSTEFMTKYEENIKERAEDIVGFAERRDFVNCLGFYAKNPPLYFSGGRGETVLPSYPFGSPLPWFHLPDSLRNDDDEIINQAEKSCISEAINCLVTFVLVSPDYAGKKKFLCDTLVTLMMDYTKTNKLKQADAIAVMLAAALEIASNHPEYKELIKDVIKNEKRVVIATAIMLFGDFIKWEESELLSNIKKRFILHKNEDFVNCSDECYHEITAALCESDSCFEHFIKNVG
jgi:hypothetical protein